MNSTTTTTTTAAAILYGAVATVYSRVLYMSNLDIEIVFGPVATVSGGLLYSIEWSLL